MTEFSSETNPQILVNGEHHDHQREDDAAAVQEELSPVRVDCECSDSAAEKEAQAKMQSLFRQVRNQIKSQVGKKSSIMELVQRVKEMEMEIAQVDVKPDEEKEAELITGDGTDVDLRTDELCAAFERKLEASQKALREEFKEQMSQVRRDMQAYTDHALKDLEGKMQSCKCPNVQQAHPKEQESKGPDRKPKPSAAPPLAFRRGRLLTRTMTTITPKTCAPVIVGPRAKSETLTSPKGDGSRLLPRDPASYPPGNKLYQNRKPLPPMSQRKKPVQAKTKPGN